MKRVKIVGLGLAAVTMGALAMLQTGCASARVSNEASFKVTAPDGTVTERRAVNRIFALGDKAVEQNLKGSLADATEADLSAGIQESSQKSEAGVIAEGSFSLGNRALGVAEKYLDARTALAGSAQAASGVYEGLAPANDSSQAVYVAGVGTLTGSPGAGGVGVYGKATCSRCAAYKAAHPDVVMIDLDNPANSKAMWDTLRDKFKFEGSTVGLPVVVTDTGFVQSAK